MECAGDDVRVSQEPRCDALLLFAVVRVAADHQADVVLQRGFPGNGQGEHNHGVRQSGGLVDGPCRHPLCAGVQRISQRSADAVRHMRTGRRIRPCDAGHCGGLPVGVSALDKSGRIIISIGNVIAIPNNIALMFPRMLSSSPSFSVLLILKRTFG